MKLSRIKEFEGQIYLSQPEVANRYSVDPATVHHWRTKLGLPGRRFGGRWFYLETALKEWDESRSQ